MTPLIFGGVPREVRDQIYKHVLGSRTGFICFDRETPSWNYSVHCYEPQRLYIREHHDPKSQITLSLLQVSKQIFAESKEAFWRYNAFYIHCPSELANLTWDNLASQMSKNLTHIEMELGIFHSGSLRFTNVSEALGTLVRWSKTGRLRRCTLKLAEYATYKVLERKLTLRDCQVYCDLLTTVGDSAGGDGFHPDVDKRLVVETRSLRRDEDDWASSHSSFLEIQVERMIDRPLVVEPLIFLHTAFGGEMWIDGELCYRNGERLREVHPSS